MAGSNVLLLFVLQIISIELITSQPSPEEYRVPRILQRKIINFQNNRLPVISSSLNAQNEHRESATLLVKPNDPSTYLDIWAPYYVTIQKHNSDKRRTLVPFAHPTPRSIQFNDQSESAATFNNPEIPRRQAQHEYVQEFQSAGFQSQYPPQVQQQDVQVNAHYPQQQLPQQFVQSSAGVVYPQQVVQQNVQLPAAPGVDYRQQVQQQYVEAPVPSGLNRVPLSPIVYQGSEPLSIVPIAPPVTENVASPLRQSFDDETSAPSNLQAPYTLPTNPPLLFPVFSQLKQSFEEETPTAATVPAVAANAAVLATISVDSNSAATLTPFATDSNTAASEAITEATTAAITTAAPAPSNFKSNSYVAPVVFNNGYPLDPLYTGYKENLPISFRNVGDQFDRFISSVNMKELIKSSRNMIDLSTQGLNRLFGLPNPTKLQPTIPFGILGKKR